MAPTPPGPYTLRNLAREVRVRVPQLVRSKAALRAGIVGSDRLDGATRVLFFLRMARLMGCPVCLKLFPRVAAQWKLDPMTVRSAIDGRSQGLTDQQVAVLTWAGEVMAAGGDAPEVPSPEAMTLSATQRAHLVAGVRLELVIHATGLMFLPHQWIQRAWEG